MKEVFKLDNFLNIFIVTEICASYFYRNHKGK